MSPKRTIHILDVIRNEIESQIRNIEHTNQRPNLIIVEERKIIFLKKTNQIVAYLLEDVPRPFATA
jgi:hypothetical protein